MAEEKKKEKWIVGEVPTQTAPVIINTEDETQLEIHQALTRVLNILEEIKKAVD